MWGKLLRRLSCRCGNHAWTCAAEQRTANGEPSMRPHIAAIIEQFTDETPDDIRLAALLSGFYDFAKMYCQHCDHVYQGSVALMEAHPMPADIQK